MDINNAPSNTVGGTSTVPGTPPGNVISGNGTPANALSSAGIFIEGNSATGNTVHGNLIGTNANGIAALGNSGEGVAIEGAPGNLIGGTVAGARNVISGNGTAGQAGRGVVILDPGAIGNLVQGNFIGTDVTGTVDLGNVLDGVRIRDGASGNTIGGTDPSARNVISGNDQWGVLLLSNARDNMVLGNYIGTEVTGMADVGNTLDGVRIRVNCTGNLIRSNRIAFNGIGVGVDKIVDTNSLNNIISQNSIFANEGLGIDLFVGNDPDGVTPNDGDADIDTGPNNLQNFPEGLAVVNNNGTSITVTGRVPTPNPSTVTVELFSNDAEDPSGFGEGQGFLMALTPSANGTFIVEEIRGTFANKFITATATDASGNTSEFSRAAPVPNQPPPPPPPPTSITVTVPNGGENWQVDTSQSITWTSSGVSGNIKIELSRDGGSTFEMLFTNTANDGLQIWMVTGPATTQARIKVSSVGNPSISDTSDANFTISQSPPPALITVTVPNGGENWQINTNQMIQWTSTGVTGNVKIELSRNGGSTFETLFADTPNDGSQTWTVTGSASNNCLMKISSVATPSVNDLSNAAFTISNPPGPFITVLVPNGGESWRIGSVQTIRWTSSGITGNMIILLTRNGGLRYEIISSNAPNTGTFQWTVTGPASSQCKIRVQSFNNRAVLDDSDNLFSITP